MMMYRDMEPVSPGQPGHVCMSISGLHGVTGPTCQDIVSTCYTKSQGPGNSHPASPVGQSCQEEMQLVGTQVLSSIPKLRTKKVQDPWPRSSVQRDLAQARCAPCSIVTNKQNPRDWRLQKQ